MARRQRTSPIEDLITVASKFPWWISVVIALISYLILHSIAAGPIMPPATTPGQMGDAAVKGLYKVLAMFGQFLLPGAFLIAAVVSLITSMKQRKLYETVQSRADVASLNEMSWGEFETLVAEHFKRKGFDVSREGGCGPDGGVDLVLRRKGSLSTLASGFERSKVDLSPVALAKGEGGTCKGDLSTVALAKVEKYLVQCKQWKAYKIGVQAVREFYGIMSATGAAGGYFVTSGVYTEDAKAFARGLNLELIDGRKLKAMIGNPAGRNEPLPVATVTPPPVAPSCPKCGAEMVKRVARQGARAGREFWGCSTFPKCNGIREMDDAKTQVGDPPEPLQARRTCPHCGTDLVLRKFKSGPKKGQEFYGCLPCKKGWPVAQS